MLTRNHTCQDGSGQIDQSEMADMFHELGARPPNPNPHSLDHPGRLEMVDASTSVGAWEVRISDSEVRRMFQEADVVAPLPLAPGYSAEDEGGVLRRDIGTHSEYPESEEEGVWASVRIRAPRQLCTWRDACIARVLTLSGGRG